MKTWEDYKEYASGFSNEAKNDIDDAADMAAFVASLIERRNELGMSQRQLASLCGLPQSSIARMETMKTVPNMDTVLKVIKPLGLQLSLTPANAQ